MALSGSLTTNSFTMDGDSRYYTVTWTATQNYSTNKSTVSWTLSAGGYTSWYAERDLTLTIAGTTVYTKTDRVQRYPGNITSGTIDISHAANGGGSFAIALSVHVYYDYVTCSGSKTETLDTMTRTVSYNANGGSGAPSAQTKNYNTTLTLSSTKPSRAGYTFKNWNTNSGGTGTSYNAGGSFTSNAKSTTLYAQWTVNTYSVSFNANGGTGAPSAQTKTYGTNLTLSSTRPTRSGYTFVGWGTSATATTAAYQPGGTYTSNSAITLYAIWKKDLTLTYDANNGTGAPSAQTVTLYNADTSVNATISTVVPTRTNYTFLGWSTSSTATSASYEAGGTIALSANTTLYAVWKLDGYAITYDANGGSGAPAQQFKEINASIELSSTIPVRNGYTFVGWGTSADATTVAYNPGATYTTNASLSLYAIWTPWTHTLAYNANGGSGAPSSQTKTTGTAITISTTTPTRVGYVFKYWSTVSNGIGGLKYNPGDTYNTDVNGGTVTLYAIWSSNNIIFYSDGSCKALWFIEDDSVSGAALSSDGSMTVTHLLEDS